MTKLLPQEQNLTRKKKFVLVGLLFSSNEIRSMVSFLLGLISPTQLSQILFRLGLQILILSCTAVVFSLVLGVNT